MNPKHSIVFFTGGVVLILGFVLMGIVPMNVVSESKSYDDHKEQLIVEETITRQIESKPIGEMKCAELNRFIISFEKGWGAAISMYNEKCP